MALGPQFENTYWHDDKGETQASILNPTGATNTDRFKIKRFEGIAARAHANSTNAQGMLFSPETGTGMRNDPLVPHETRIAAIQKGLGMDDPVKYADRAGKVKKVSGGRTTVGPRQAQTAINAYTTAVDNSTMPTHIIEKHMAQKPVLAIANEDMSRGHITEGGIIRLPLQQTHRFEKVPERTVTKVSGGVITGPINNPKLGVHADKIDWDSHEGARADVLEHAVITGPKGTQFMSTDSYDIPKIINNPEYKQPWEKDHNPEIPRVIDNPAAGRKFNFKVAPQAQKMINEHPEHNRFDFRDLPEGYSMNVFPGKGNIKDPNVKTEDFQVWNGTHPTNYSDRHVTFHTRNTLSDPVKEQVTVPAHDVLKRGAPKVSESTTVHELGHHFDKNLGDSWNQRYTIRRADPVEEGVADGVADAYSRHKDFSARMFTEGETGPTHKHHGYTTEFSGFSNRSDKALYSAMRAHASATPDPEVFNQTPSRADLVDQRGPKRADPRDREHRKVANQLLLGHLYDSHEHVRKTLAGLGYEKEGRAARQMYQDRDPNKPVQTHQPQLPGFEV